MLLYLSPLEAPADMGVVLGLCERGGAGALRFRLSVFVAPETWFRFRKLRLSQLKQMQVGLQGNEALTDTFFAAAGGACTHGYGVGTL